MHWFVENLSPVAVELAALVTSRSAAGRATAQSVALVLKSLTANCWHVLRFIVAASKAGTPLTHDALLAQCKAKMLVKDSGALTGLLRELIDHEIVQRNAFVSLKADVREVEAALAELERA